MSWLRDAWNALFDSEPRRRPRRKRCECGHPWRDHNAAGCDFLNCPCALNRLGKPARRALGVVKERTGT